MIADIAEARGPIGFGKGLGQLSLASGSSEWIAETSRTGISENSVIPAGPPTVCAGYTYQTGCRLHLVPMGPECPTTSAATIAVSLR